MSKLLIYSMHRTDAYWRFVARQLKHFHASTLVSDQLGSGDVSTQPRFYDLLKGGEPERFVSRHLGEPTAADIIARCRVLRSLDYGLAIRMVGAMWMAIEEIVRKEKPDFALSFCIDRYSMDILARIVELHDIPFAEMTASVLPGQIQFLRRGRGLPTILPSQEQIDKGIEALADPLFAPSYVQLGQSYGLGRFLRTFAHHELRGVYFSLVRRWRRDPLNCHYLDALKRLEHKIGYGDLAQSRFLDNGWKEKFDRVHAADRVFLALQVYPEASMDYWLESHDLLRYYDVVERQAQLLSAGGFAVFVKDHPLMFGFRQEELYRRIRRVSNATFVPHSVSGRYLVSNCQATVTLTGTVGLEAALAGKCAFTAAGGFYHGPGETTSYATAAELDGIAPAIRNFRPGDVEGRRHRLISHMVEISAPGALTRVAGFSESDEAALNDARAVVASLNQRYSSIHDQLDPRRSRPARRTASAAGQGRDPIAPVAGAIGAVR